MAKRVWSRLTIRSIAILSSSVTFEMRFWKVSISSRMNCSDCLILLLVPLPNPLLVLNYLQKILIFRGSLPLWHLFQLTLPFFLKLYLQQTEFLLLYPLSQIVIPRSANLVNLDNKKKIINIQRKNIKPTTSSYKHDLKRHVSSVRNSFVHYTSTLHDSFCVANIIFIQNKQTKI